MIYGLIPIGGKGTRLGLPFSKEMLPLKNFDHYQPVVSHLIRKMKLAGAERFVFVHGLEFKEDVKNYFNDSNCVHILQTELGFGNVLKDFVRWVGAFGAEKVLFGLPDSVFNTNPFMRMVEEPGIVAGCFITSASSKVDRLENDNLKKFQIKVAKTPDNSNWFWGVIKFDYENLKQMVHDDAFGKTSEIGELLNMYGFTIVRGDQYVDLGTWGGYNQYLTFNDYY